MGGMNYESFTLDTYNEIKTIVMLENVFSFKGWCCCVVTKYTCLLQISTVLCAEHCNRNQIL